MSIQHGMDIRGNRTGRLPAQALQALACGVELTTDMNPVLLKPETDTGAQVIVQGRRLGSFQARAYGTQKPLLAAAVMDSFNRLKAQADLAGLD